jgi:monofunctional biosynthetic peptidoglycan transglycosylase
VFAATGASAASARREPASVMAIYLTVAPPGKWASECDNVGRMVRPGKAKRMTVAYDILRLPRLARPLRAVALALLSLLLLPYVITPIYAVVEPVSTVMLWRRMTGEPVARTYVPLSHISPNLMRAVIVAEDGRFCRHYGVDLAEIRDAIKEADDLDDMRGGSTITQQVAKNLFLWPGRSYLRKALEFPLALWIDLVLSKRRILEIYLNIAEWGPSGQFGAEAGSRYAFGKSAGSLSHYQAALLAAVLPNPHDRNAHRPGPGLRRLAGLYVARARRAPGATACLRRTP